MFRLIILLLLLVLVIILVFNILSGDVSFFNSIYGDPEYSYRPIYNYRDVQPTNNINTRIDTSADPISLYDTSNLLNPLTPPTYRPPEYVFRTTYQNPIFNNRTQLDSYDNYNYVGNLVDVDVYANSEQSYNQPKYSILRVMGRLKYRHNDKYEYYVLLPQIDGSDIKINIETKRNYELYDGDEVIIPEMGNKKYQFKRNKTHYSTYY